MKTPITRNGKTCNCYVGGLTEFLQISLHYGAHNPTCPTYSKSLDPVDDMHDQEFRVQYDREFSVPYGERRRS